MYFVYLHNNKINNKKYIGITKQKPENRWGLNGYNYRSSPYFYFAIQKYGWNNFEHIILYNNLTKEEACEKEIELINKYKTQNKKYGYNIMEGGSAPSLPKEVKDKLSEALKGNQNGKGHPCDINKRRKISEAQKGRKLTEEHKRKLSLAASKRHVICSDEKKKLLSQNYPYKKKIYCIETNIIYDSVQECARQLNLHATNVTKVCKGIHRTTGGYHLQYYNDTINA